MASTRAVRVSAPSCRCTTARKGSAKRPVPAGRRGVVTLTIPLTREEAEEFDSMEYDEFDCYPMYSSMADVVRYSLML